MVEAGVVSDKDRLPWLADYRDPVPTKKRRSLIVPLVAVATVAAGGAALWMRPEARIAELPKIAAVDVPAAEPVSEVTMDAPDTELAVPAAEARPRAAVTRPHRNRGHARRIRTASVERGAFDRVMADQGDPAAEPSTMLSNMAATLTGIPGVAEQQLNEAPIVRPTVNASAKVQRRQTVRLGVFLSPDQAEIAWQKAIREYTFLVTMPKRVAPVRFAGSGKRYYTLDLGTPSRTHAKQLCRNLKTIGYACTVA